jgi:hypothetical protein
MTICKTTTYECDVCNQNEFGAEDVVRYTNGADALLHCCYSDCRDTAIADMRADLLLANEACRQLRLHLKAVNAQLDDWRKAALSDMPYGTQKCHSCGQLDAAETMCYGRDRHWYCGDCYREAQWDREE